MTSRYCPLRLLVALIVTSSLAPGCATDDGDRFLTPAGYDPGGGGGGAGYDPGGGGGGTEVEELPEECTPGETFCHDGARWRCGDDGVSTLLVQDCTVGPHDSCAIGPCRTGDAPMGACCVSREPFCFADVDVEGKGSMGVEFSGLWDDDFACSGSVRDDGFNWSLWARVPACEGRFVRIILSGYRDGWEPGQTYPLCRTATTEPAVHVTLMADSATFGNLDGSCSSVTGSITFHDFGLEPGEPFHITIEGALLDASSGATRIIDVESSGLLVPFE